jgi:hypothetical protein
MRKAIFALSLPLLASVVAYPSAAAAAPAKVTAVASRGAAAPGNNASASLLVVVTDQATGAGVTTLSKSDFTIIDHFGLPGQQCGFSNDITGFNNVGTGAYQISIATHSTTPPPGGCKWVGGTYLGQVMVKSATVEGQTAFTLGL